ncbi:MAG: PKD domain-containing protein [Cyclobacteriaceae bacterium]|jgi:hypothetical protein
MARLLCVLVAFLPAVAWGQAQTHWVENKGQWRAEYDAMTKAPGGRVYINDQGFSVLLLDQSRLNELHEEPYSCFLESQAYVPSEESIRLHAVRFRWLNTQSSTPEFSNPLPVYYNYFLGNDNTRWVSGAKSFAQMTYCNVYEGVDVQVKAWGEHIKYDWVVRAGADAGAVRYAVEGASDVRINDGELIVSTTLGNLVEGRPVAYQIVEGSRCEVPCLFRLRDEVVTFDFPEGYDPRYDLIIDPVLIFSTYSGSTADNWGSTATPGERGTLYSAGVTNHQFGGEFPATPGAFEVDYQGDYDIAILKYDSAGTQLLYAAYLGGASADSPHSLVVTANEDLLVMGTSSSADFPTTAGVFDRSFGGGTPQSNVISYPNGSDLIISRISSDGTQLKASTYLGGSLNDGLNPTGGALVRNYGDQLRGDIIENSTGDVFISSVTSSPDFPAINSFSTTYRGGATDALIAKLSPNLNTLIWSTFLGGNQADASHSIQVDWRDNIYVAGGTASINFPATAGVYQPAFGGAVDGFVTRIRGNGAEILSSTFTGTANYNQVYFLGLSTSREIYVYGQTVGPFPVSTGVYSNPNSGQFIQKFDSALRVLQFSTVVGAGRGIPDISPTAFLVNDCNNLYLSGWGGGINQLLGFWNSSTVGMPVTPNAFQPTTSGSDFYFMVLTADASEFLYGTFLGGSLSKTHVDGGTSRFDKSGVVYHAVCSGCAAFNSTGGPTSDFPTTPGAWSRFNQSANCNNAAFKFDLSLLRAVLQTNTTRLNQPGISQLCLGDTLALQNFSIGGRVFEWKLGDDTRVTRTDTTFFTHRYRSPGTYPITLVVIDEGTCKGIDSVSTSIRIIQPTGMAQPDSDACAKQPVQLTASGGVSYRWQNEQGDVLSTQPVFIYVPLRDGALRATISDNNGCVVIDTVNLNVTPALSVRFTLEEEFDCFNLPLVTLAGEVKGNADNVTVDFGDGTRATGSTATHQYQREGVFTIKLIAETENCTYDSAAVQPVRAIKVPNVITPGDVDSRNDFFQVVWGDQAPAVRGQRVELKILNRWGKTLYASEDYRNDWSGADLVAGIYYYEVNVVGVINCRGWFQIVR